MKKSTPQESKSPTRLMDTRIQELDDWRGAMLDRLRTLINEADPEEADPEVVEEWKWRALRCGRSTE